MKYAIILLVIGFCVEGFGILQKVLHTPLADTFLITGKCILFIGCGLFVTCFLKSQNKLQYF
jgi:hypothetical protein